MKGGYELKIGLGIFAVIVLVVIEMFTGAISGISGAIPLGIDPDLQLLGLMGILTVFTLVLFLYIKMSYMK